MNGILHSNVIFPVCNNQMNLVNYKSFLDRRCFRCIKSFLNYYIKISIKKNFNFGKNKNKIGHGLFFGYRLFSE